MALPHVTGHGPILEGLGGMQNGGCIPHGWSVKVTKDVCEVYSDAGDIYYKVYDDENNLRGQVHESWNPAGTRVFLETYVEPRGKYEVRDANGIKSYFKTAAEAVVHALEQVPNVKTPSDNLVDMLSDCGYTELSDGLSYAYIQVKR